MCRFAFYMGPPITLASLVTEPDHSIINQSHHAREREEPLNGDGFGVAWHDPQLTHPFVTFKEVYPAWSSRNLRSLAPAISSDCILTHVRAATAGAVTQQNCHPFGARGYVFMHNGGIGNWLQLRRSLLAGLSDRAFQGIEGSTDSEVIFAMLLDALDGHGENADLEQMASAMLSTIEALERATHGRPDFEPSALNLVLCNGETCVITRYASPSPKPPETLYYWHGADYRCIDGVCMMEGGANDALLVSSEPLSADPDWSPVPENHMALIRRGQAPEFRSIELPPLH